MPLSILLSSRSESPDCLSVVKLKISREKKIRSKYTAGWEDMATSHQYIMQEGRQCA